MPRRITDTGNFTAVRAGQDFSCALNTSGEPWCLGPNGSGQLGQGHAAAVNGLVLVPLDEEVVGFDLGSAFASALTLRGATYCWGENQEHQLGLGQEAPVGTDEPALLGTKQRERVGTR